MTSKSVEDTSSASPSSPPLYLAEGLLAVHKPLTWTSNDVVAYIRGILTRDAKDRNAGGGSDNNNNNKRGRGRNKKQMMKVGHGGTLDPLASGVLVLGIGKGTTQLQSYLEGDKQYVAVCELGYETTTLDAEGDVVKEMEWAHVKSVKGGSDCDSTSTSSIEGVLSKFQGKIQQVPPLYSAIRVDGKRLYEIARKGDVNSDDVEIPTREVEVYGVKACASLEEDVVRSGVVDGRKYREAVKAMKDAESEAAAKALAEGGDDKVDANDEGGETKKHDNADGSGGGDKKKKYSKKRNDKDNKKNMFSDTTVPSISADNCTLELPQFALEVQCGGGTYIRSLVRDIGYELDTVATMTGLVRTKQGPFVLEDALRREDWNAEKIYAAIKRV